MFPKPEVAACWPAQASVEPAGRLGRPVGQHHVVGGAAHLVAVQGDRHGPADLQADEAGVMLDQLRAVAEARGELLLVAGATGMRFETMNIGGIPPLSVVAVGRLITFTGCTLVHGQPSDQPDGAPTGRVLPAEGTRGRGCVPA